MGFLVVKTKRKYYMDITLPILYFIMILFITVIIRNPNLNRMINIKTFRGLALAIDGDKNQSRQILYNVLLYIPMGYLLVRLTENFKESFIIAFFVTLFLETIQYFTCRGQFDIEDILNNSIGAIIGIVLWEALRRFRWELLVPYALIMVGIIGCIVAERSLALALPINYTKQFSFNIISTSLSDTDLQIQGECYIYNRNTPDYELFLDESRMNTEIHGNEFFSTTPVSLGKHELRVQFEGYSPISTGIFLVATANDDIDVEYVPGNVKLLYTVPEDFLLKAYNSDQVTYVFEDTVNKRIRWYIGWDITPSTEVIYHIQTNESNKLPAKRIPYGFDNRGFRVGGRNTNELESVAGYRVLEMEIPDSFSVTAITVGYNTLGNITWSQSFRIDK